MSCPENTEVRGVVIGEEVTPEGRWYLLVEVEMGHEFCVVILPMHSGVWRGLLYPDNGAEVSVFGITQNEAGDWEALSAGWPDDAEEDGVMIGMTGVLYS